MSNTILHSLKVKLSVVIDNLYHLSLKPEDIELVQTPEIYTGDYTFNTFGLSKQLRKNPIEIANSITANLNPDKELKSVSSVNAYINICLQDSVWVQISNEILTNKNYGLHEPGSKQQTIMIEFSSPNTNKPLHLGHIRNNLIGNSVCNLYKAIGYNVIKANLVNDRGIHICKSMLAWQKWGNGETPESSGIKGDHLVGNYYVLFDKEFKRQIEELKQSSMNEDEAKKKAPIMLEAQAMLKKWEDKDQAVISLWKKMNNWVYAGFADTYKELGIAFDLTEYESETYLLGKSLVMENYEKGKVEKESDGSLWVDFTQLGLDRKLLMRGDGTSVYITQDIGTAVMRKEKYNVEKMIYVVAVEQQYHFKVLKMLLNHFGYDWYDELFHLSYEMVALPSGRMKSREGTVVDADDLMEEMTNHALNQFKERDNGSSDLSLAKVVGIGALKYHIIKVDPQKNILFDPSKTIDFQGNSGAFIQYSYARIKSILRLSKSVESVNITEKTETYKLNDEERKLIQKIYTLPDVVEQAAIKYNPSLVANYLFDLSQLFNQFYHQHKVNVDDLVTKQFRLRLCSSVARSLYIGANILGIELPDKM